MFLVILNNRALDFFFSLIDFSFSFSFLFSEFLPQLFDLLLLESSFSAGLQSHFLSKVRTFTTIHYSLNIQASYSLFFRPAAVKTMIQARLGHMYTRPIAISRVLTLKNRFTF